MPTGQADEKRARQPTSDLLAEISAERHPDLARVPPPAGPSQRRAGAKGGSAFAAWKKAFLSLPGWQRWGALAVSGLLVVVLLLIAFGGGQPAPSEPAPSEPAPVGTTPPLTPEVLVDMGVVVVTALPWGELSEVNDTKGYVQELPADPYTPLWLKLPPGRYTLHLRHPDYTEVLSCEVEVSLGVMSACAVDFGRPTVTEFFKESGWWR